MRILFFFIFVSFFGNTFSQVGMFSIGARSTTSLFNDGGTDNFGLGLGGQFRLQLAERINTDWFFDYLRSDIETIGNRTDHHIGWSVLFYPYLKKENDIVISTLFKPFILAGHCFDYTRLQENQNPSNFRERWSSAVQAGLGTHVNLNQRLDLTIMTQYMMHLGNHIHAHVGGNALHLSEEQGASLEGHFLITLGLNLKIGELW
jgi:hypothetical protein